jgi:dihydroorotase
LTTSDIAAAPRVTPKYDFDLVIQGGTVIDPSQKLHEVLDVAIKDGKIAAVAPEIGAGRARRSLSAVGQIVTPGWIDLHVHAYEGLAEGLDVDHYCMGRGTTTCVDAGSTGHVFVGRFVQDIVRTRKTRVYTLVHMDPVGPTTGLPFAQDNIDWLDPRKVTAAALRNRPAVVGIKVHLQMSKSRRPQDLEMEFMKRGIEAAEGAGMPLMAHINDTYYPLRDHLALMRKGDIFTHCFNDYPQTRPIDDEGRVLPEAWESRERGIVWDVAMSHDHPHFRFDVAEKFLQQGFPPDTISSDNNRAHATEDVFDLPLTVAKFLALGMDLDKAIECVTVNPSKVFDFGVDIGTLRPGSEADVSVFELQKGRFEFKDGSGATRVGDTTFVSKAVTCRGELLLNSL